MTTTYLLVAVVLNGLIAPETMAISTATFDSYDKCQVAKSVVESAAKEGFRIGWRVNVECKEIN